MVDKITSWAARAALAIWLGAVAAAGYPTWEWWRFESEPGGTVSGFDCVGRWGHSSWVDWLLTPVRTDIGAILSVSEMWAVPALLVVGAFLAGRGCGDPRVAGRRGAAALALMAVARPLTWDYFDSEACAPVPLLSRAWFGEVACGWGSTETALLVTALLVTALLVLLASTLTPRGPRAPLPRTAVSVAVVPAPGSPVPYEHRGMVWRRSVALLVDYLIVVHILGAVLRGLLSMIPGDSGSGLEHGVLNRVASWPLDFEPRSHAIMLAIFLYFWSQHVLWGRTPGQRLLGLRVVPAGPMITRRVVDVLAGSTADPAATTPVAAGAVPRQEGGRRPHGLRGRRAALRTLVFPVVTLLPEVGLVVLIADALVALLAPDGRALHDLAAGTAVVHDRRSTPGRLASPSVPDRR
ncbi:RDD family protein [Microtetraspora sp. AC03309]|uniref:RDD family protein n=1 Tax=Microtetraspora sp. AC03309 TaxID=2779376 RepID=UPI001E3925A4|nr:RDD family protein [Microtetraspora sp. AC03309]MCC5577434.1 RDD family protein [Microtetraspora sp. AC03309]